METATLPARRASLAARWMSLSSHNRRRIVLGALVAVALAARDLMLLLAAGGMFALSEAGSSARPQPSAA